MATSRGYRLTPGLCGGPWSSAVPPLTLGAIPDAQMFAGRDAAPRSMSKNGARPRREADGIDVGSFSGCAPGGRCWCVVRREL